MLCGADMLCGRPPRPVQLTLTRTPTSELKICATVTLDLWNVLANLEFSALFFIFELGTCKAMKQKDGRDLYCGIKRPHNDSKKNPGQKTSIFVQRLVLTVKYKNK